MRPPTLALTPFLRRWPLGRLAVLSLVLLAILAVSWSGTSPAGAQDDYQPDSQVVADVWTYAKETANGPDHVLRWFRVLHTFDALDDMTTAEAQGYADNGWTRWEPVVAALNSGEPDSQVIADIRGYAAETTNGFDHVHRWFRVLHTFDALDEMTAAEAQGYADNGWQRWDPVAAELAAMEAPASEPEPTPTPEPTQEPTPEPTPEPEQTAPGTPANFAVTVEEGELDISATWDALDGATSYQLAWRYDGEEFEADDTATVTTNSATVTVSGYGRWIIQLQGCNDAGCGAAVTGQVDALPAPQYGPLSVFVKANPAEPRVDEATELSAVPSNAPEQETPSYKWEIEGNGEWHSYGSDSATLSFLANQPESWTFRVTVSLDNGDSATSDPLTVEWTEKLRAPLEDPDEGASGNQDSSTAPVSLVDIGGGCADASCPDAVIGSADGGPGNGEITVKWTLAASGGAPVSFLTAHRESGTTVFNTASIANANLRSHTFTNLDQTKTYDVLIRADGSGKDGDSAQANGVKAAPTPPTFDSAAVNGKTLTITFSENLDTASMPVGSAFTVSGGRTGTGTAAISGATATVTLDSAVSHGETVTVSYTKPATNPLQDTVAGNPVATFTGKAVTNNAPEPVPTTGPVALVDIGGECVGTGCPDAPTGSAQGGPGDGKITVIWTPATTGGTVANNWAIQWRETGSTDTHNQTILNDISLRKHTITGLDSSKAYNVRVIGISGNGALVGDIAQATGVIAKGSPPVFSSAKVNGNLLTITFNEGLAAGSSAATDDFFVTVGTSRRNATGIAISGATVTLTLASAVLHTDTVVKVRYTQGTNRLKDVAGNEVASFTDQTVTNITDDTTAPTFSRAAVNGKTLTVTFSENLDTGSKPMSDAFKVVVNATTRDVAPGVVDISGKTVTLTLASAVLHTDGVFVRYVKPSSNPLQDAAGNPVATFSNKVATNNTPDPDAKPVFSSAWVFGKTLWVFFRPDLDPGSAPAASAFTVTATSPDGGTRTIAGRVTASVSGAVRFSNATVTVALESLVAYGETVRVSYTRPASGNRLQAPGGAEVEDFSGKWVLNKTPAAAAVFFTATVQKNPLYLWIEFTEVLDDNSEPAHNAFTVTATSPNGQTRSIRGASTGSVGGTGSTVLVKLASEVPSGAKVTVSYSKPSANPLIDRGTETPLESFSGMGVANGPPRIESVAIVSDPGADRTYGERDTIRVQVTFTAPVTLNTRGSTPRLMIKMLRFAQNGTHWIQSRWADYESGSRSDTLTFAYEVGSSDRGQEGVGVPWHSIDLNGGMIRTVWAWPPAQADLEHTGLNHDTNHKVDGRISPPRFHSASVDGTTLVVVFDEALDEDFVPTHSAFRVTVNGAGRSVASGGVAIAGATVRLTLSSAVLDTDEVKVRYTRPSSNGLRDAAGNEVESFADKDVAGDETPPVFSSAAVAEDGTTLTVTFDENLDTVSAPAPGDFHVTVGSARRNVASGGVSISGKVVTLTLASAVIVGETVTVRYTKPATNPLRDAAGNQVATFADQDVTNNSTLSPHEVPQKSIWSATLTLKTTFGAGGTALGCKDSDSNALCSTALTDNSFTYEGETYQVTSVIFESSGTSTFFDITLDKAIPVSLRQTGTLQYHGSEVRFYSNASYSSQYKRVGWAFTTVPLSENQKISMALTVPGDGN